MEKKTETKSLRLTKSVIDKVYKRAEAESRNFNNMVEVILKESFKDVDIKVDIKELER